MHSLALGMLELGHRVTGSDDVIFEPSKSRLKKHGLHPKKLGWNSSRISNDIDSVILGMHAKEDNPELIEAKKKSIKIFSYPEFIFEMSKEKITNISQDIIAKVRGKFITTDPGEEV